jgi:DNA-binding transcriptional LysR family regulator
MSLDANDLILFSRIVEEGSFSRAAELTGLPKSTLSRRLTMLEDKLGERLLMRSTRRLAITEFGEQMLDYGKRLSEETEAASAMALHRQELPRGLLRVSMPPDFADLDLTPLLLRFAASYPQVRLELDLSPRRVDLVSERFDLAVRVASRLPDDNTLVARKLGTLQLHLYASPAYLNRYGEPEKPVDLSSHICLRLISGNGEALPWRLTSAYGQWEGIPNGPLASNSLGLQRDLAIHGMGIVGLADQFVRGWVEKGLLKPVLLDWALPEVTIWCVTPGRRLLPARTTAFVEMLRSVFDKGSHP